MAPSKYNKVTRSNQNAFYEYSGFSLSSHPHLSLKMSGNKRWASTKKLTENNPSFPKATKAVQANNLYRTNNFKA